MAQWTLSSGPALAGCSLYDDLEILDMCSSQRGLKIYCYPSLSLLSSRTILQSLFFFFQHSARDQDKRSCWSDLTPWRREVAGSISSIGGWCWRNSGGCIEYVLCSSPFSQTNNFEINVHNYLWPPLLRTTAIKLINRGRLSVSLDCCVIRRGHK